MSTATPTTAPVHRCDRLTVAGTVATLYRDGRPIGLIQCLSIAAPSAAPVIRYVGLIASRSLSSQAHLTQAAAESDVIAWHEGRDPAPYVQHSVMPAAQVDVLLLRSRLEKAETKLATIRAMATRSMPQLINLAAIDRILAE